MNHRRLTHKIEWRDAWQKMREERKRKAKISYDQNFFKKAGEDFSKRIKLNEYEYGEQSTAILDGIINCDYEVLEIGTGPGTLTIPLSKKVQKITSIEFSPKQIKRLKKNLHEKKITNVRIIENSWEQAIDDEVTDSFDLVVCSHFLWQVLDLEMFLCAMERASRKFCAIIQPCGRDTMIGKIFEKIANCTYTGQFEPDADYFPYIILREWGRLVHVTSFCYTFKRDMEEQIRYVANFIGRFIEVDHKVEQQIRIHLLKRSNDHCFTEENKAVVLWWKP